MPLPTIPSGNVASAIGGGYEVANSCRFNDDDSAFLSKTFSGDGTSHDIGTVSVWLKRGELGAEQGIFTAGSSNRNFNLLFVHSYKKQNKRWSRCNTNLWLFGIFNS